MNPLGLPLLVWLACWEMVPRDFPPTLHDLWGFPSHYVARQQLEAAEAHREWVWARSHFDQHCGLDWAHWKLDAEHRVTAWRLLERAADASNGEHWRVGYLSELRDLLGYGWYYAGVMPDATLSDRWPHPKKVMPKVEDDGAGTENNAIGGIGR